MSAILSMLTKFLLYRQLDLNEICSRSVGVKLNHLLIIQIKIDLSCVGVWEIVRFLRIPQVSPWINLNTCYSGCRLAGR